MRIVQGDVVAARSSVFGFFFRESIYTAVVVNYATTSDEHICMDNDATVDPKRVLLLVSVSTETFRSVRFRHQA